MILSIVYLIAGLALILIGANILTDGSAAIARRFGVSDLTIGLTVVAFGTSAPELAITIISAAQGEASMALGNIVGSNIFNILVIIGLVAAIRPIKVTAGIMANEIPLVILSSLALLAIGSKTLLDPGLPAEVTRTEGILLLLFFAIFMRYTFASAKSASQPDPAGAQAASKPGMPIWKAIIWVVGGLAALIGGGDRLVAGASDIALAIGMSQATVGLTIVAIGTSLPELATSVAAALKGHTAIALGNVIGSNIFNIFMVLGISATVSPLPQGDIGLPDLLVLTAASLLFWLMGRTVGRSVITRAEGILLLTGYVLYTIWLLV